MLEKFNKGMVGVSLSVVILILYYEIRQANESLRRIELKLQHIYQHSPGHSIQMTERKEEP